MGSPAFPSVPWLLDAHTPQLFGSMALLWSGTQPVAPPPPPPAAPLGADPQEFVSLQSPAVFEHAPHTPARNNAGLSDASLHPIVRLFLALMINALLRRSLQ
jgi:hypothetical protein